MLYRHWDIFLQEQTAAAPNRNRLCSLPHGCGGHALNGFAAEISKIPAARFYDL